MTGRFVGKGAPFAALFALVVVASALLSSGCGGGGGSDEDVAGAVDGGGDAVVQADATPDVAPPPDVAPDVAPDVQPDVAPDVQPDVAADVPPDVAPDIAPDVAPDVAADVPPPCPTECCDDADCDDGDPCTVNECASEGACAFQPYACDDGEACTEDVCLGDGECAFEAIEGCCPLTALWEADFESGSQDGVTVVDRANNTRPDEDAWDQPIVWGVDDERAHGGRRALYSGNPATRSYDNERHVSTVAASPAVPLTADMTAGLRFWVWMDVEDTEGYDALSVEAQVLDVGAGDDGEDVVRARVPLWSKPADFPKEAWRSVTIDLSAFAGETVRVAFVFDTRDGSSNGFEGVYVDDVVVGVRCAAPACAADADCDDGLACTADSCADGVCARTFGEGCCLNAIDCHDGDACSADECVAGEDGDRCRNFALPIEGCCNADADCDDGDPCTADRCDANRCGHIPSGEPGCCEKDEDCLDDDPCTEATCQRPAGACVVANTCECRYDAQCRDDDELCTRDTCTDGLCMREPTLRAGCCESQVFVDHFETGETSRTRWTFSNTNASTGWTTWDGPATTSSALYYGNPASGSYASGTARNSGTATTREIILPAAVDVSLSFDLYLAIESGTDHDTFSFSLLEGSDELTIFQKDFQTQTWTWQHVTVDLSGFAGQAVRFRLAFDTMDGEGNDGEGVYVDEFVLVSSCRARACESDGMCYDGFGATTERCVGGVCQYSVADQLCDTDAQCEDGDICTRDVCELGGCVFRPIAGCCAGDQACDDNDVCTNDSCVGSNPPLCQFERIPGCCEDVSDCDDGNPCTEDTCPGFGSYCDNPWIDGCCLTSSQCQDDDPCTDDRCVGNACEHVWACCETDAECDDGDDVCTTDTCADGRCLFTLDGENPDCCEAEPLRIDFEDGTAQGFELGAGSSGDAWRVLSTSQGGVAHGGTHALYFGNSSGSGYASPTQGTATSPPFALPYGQALTLRFWVWVDTEEGYDDVTAYLDAGGSSTLIQTWEGYTGAWVEETVDVSYLAGGEARLRFVFSADDSYAERGVFVDDIVVESACAPVSCDADRDCSSPTGCIEGRCVAGGCRYEQRTDCCDTAAACDDLNPCTTDRCQNDVCTYSEIAGCCRSASDCGDGVGCIVGACVENRCQQACDPQCEEECCLDRRDCDDADECTVDVCGEAFVCGHLWACCETDDECDDGDDLCTTDRCIERFCQFEIDSTNPECCQPEPYLVDFEDGTLGGFTSTGGAGGDSWHVVTGEAHTGTRSMAYNDAGGEYNNSSFGVAEGPAFELPAGQDLTLSFWMKVDTESGYDGVTVSLVGDGAGAELGYYEDVLDWFLVSEDISYLGGNTVRLRFAFESDTSVTAGGVWVDDIAVTSACAPPSCNGDTDCRTPTGCIEGRCVGGACVFEPQPDCCELDVECDDADPCTLNRCVQNRCEFPGDPANPGCCHADEDCDDGAPCTDDRCVNGHCTRQCPTGCAYQFPYAEDFDSATTLGSSCWSTLNASGGGTSGWNFVADSYDIAGPHLAFDAFDSTASGAYTQCVRSPGVDATFATTARLRFDHVGFSWDTGFSVKARVSNDNGASWRDVWTQTITSDVSGPTTVDVYNDVAGSATVRVALCVTYSGGGFFPYMGWEIDNVRLEGDVYVGEPPVWDTTPEDWLAPIGAETRFPLAGHDPDGDPLTFRLGDDAPGFLSIDDAGDGTAELVATPAIGDEQAYEFHLILADPWLETPLPVGLTITVPGNAPEVVDPGPQTVVVNDVLRVTVEATDADGDPLTFVAGRPLPSFATVRDAGGGRAWVTLSPRIADAGAHVVPLVVSDGTQNVPFELAVAVVYPGDAAPLVEDFEDAPDLAGLGWSTTTDEASRDNDWLLLPGEPSGYDKGHAPIFFDVPLVDAFEDTLVSPIFDATGLVDVRVRWTTDYRDYAPLVAEPPVELSLLVSADAGATWTPVWQWTETDGSLPPSTVEAAAPALDGAAEARVAFRIAGGSSDALLSWTVDDVMVFGALAPPPAE